MVDCYHLVEVLKSRYRVEAAAYLVRSVQLVCKVLIEDLVDERGFAAARYARHADKFAEREFNVDILQIIFLCAVDGQHLAVARPALLGHGYESLAAQVLTRYRALAVDYVVDRAGRDYLAAVDARTGTDIDNIIRGSHRILVMLNDYQGVAYVAQMAQGRKQLFVVALMQADARLVKDIEHAHERRAYLCREPYTLGFAAREGGRGSCKVKVIEAHARQERKAALYLLDYHLGYHALALGQHKGVKKFQLLGY